MLNLSGLGLKSAKAQNIFQDSKCLHVKFITDTLVLFILEKKLQFFVKAKSLLIKRLL